MSCRGCKLNNTNNKIDIKPKNFFDFSFLNNSNNEVTQTLATGTTGITGITPCGGPCLGPTGDPSRYAAVVGCAQGVVNAFGICDTATGGITYITAPYGFLAIDNVRAQNAVESASSQFPTGSFTGYINSLFNNFTNEVESSTTELLTSIFISILLQSYLLFAVICITLMAVNTITVGLGLFLLVFGLIVIGAALAVIYTQTVKFADRVQNAVNTNTEGVVDNFICAIGSGLCCYGGSPTCCCNGMTGAKCTNKPFAPGENPPCGRSCSNLRPSCPPANIVSEIIDGID